MKAFVPIVLSLSYKHVPKKHTPKAMLKRIVFRIASFSFSFLYEEEVGDSVIGITV